MIKKPAGSVAPEVEMRSAPSEKSDSLPNAPPLIETETFTDDEKKLEGYIIVIELPGGKAP